MICSGKVTISMFGIVFFIGYTLGAFTLPPLADKYGRKSTTLLTMVAFVVDLTLILVLPTGDHQMIYVIIGSMFFQGLGTALRHAAGYCYLLEFFPSEDADFVGSAFFICDGATYIWLSLYFLYISKDWHWVLLFFDLVAVLSSGLVWLYLPESPKWLYSKHMFPELKQALLTIRRVNRVAPGSRISAWLDEPERMTRHLKALNASSVGAPPSEAEKEQSNFKFIISNKKILYNLVLMIVVWLGSSFCYYLISYQLKYIKGDMYLNGIVSSLSECTAYAVSGLFLSKLGFKQVTALSFALGALGTLCLLWTSSDSQALLSLFVLGSKFGISAAFNLAYLGNLLIFPVRISATSVGICQCFAKIFTIFSPYVAEIKPESVPLWFVVIFSVAAGVASIALVMPKSKK